jgi:hypothetical protein
VNVVSLKNEQTRQCDIGSGATRTITFECDYEGAWQRIPQPVLDEIEKSEIEIIVKFGMSLLRIDGVLSAVPVFSFHHGDPSRYRGRPAGFYELLNNAEKSGIIVQRLSNKLDAGDIYASVQSRIEPHSYKKTALNFYGLSKYLLRQAVINYQRGRQIDLGTDGKNYRLPSNFTALKFIAVLALRKIRRLGYGAFVEKRWKVALVPFSLDFEDDIVLSSDTFDIFPIDKRYTFFADPFFSLSGRSVRLEAMHAGTGLGEIIEVELDDRNRSRQLLSGKHYSYPFPFEIDGKEYLLPEVASHSNPYYLAINGELGEEVALKGFESSRIVDATLVRKDDIFFMFYGEDQAASNVLHLAYAESIDHEFTRHPMSPICIDPSGSRMGGRVVAIGNRLYRFGQNNCRGYGSSINVFEVKLLTRDDYREGHRAGISIESAKGPHTIDIDSNKTLAVIDYYEEKFSPLAGYRRVLSRLSHQ